MKRVHVMAALAAALLSASSARAQFGLYGAPDLLRLPPVQHASAERISLSGLAARPATPTAAFIPDDPGYDEQIMRPVIETPMAPIPVMPSTADTFVGSAPGDTSVPAISDGQPHLAPQLGEGDQTISRMLREAGAMESNPWAEPPVETDCAPIGCDPCQPCYISPWFVGISGLIMTRDEPNRVWTTYSTSDQAIQLMHTNDTDEDWQGGGEITFGRMFCCDRWSVGVTYWSLAAFDGFASMAAPGGVSTPLDFTDVTYADPALDGGGLRPQTLFDNAQEHRLWRTNEFHNVEINFVRHRAALFMGDYRSCNPLSIDWLAGVRFLRFEEDLTFGSLEAGAYTWDADPDHQGYLENRCTNNLIGVQVGCDLNYGFWRNFELFVKPKLGIYNNHIRNSFMAYRGDGQLFSPDPTPAPPPVRSAVPGSYPVNSSVDVVSFMTELDLGLRWQFTPRWSVNAGYRVLVATGIGLSDNQIPMYIVDIPELANVNHNGQLVLHGVFTGLEFTF